MSEVKAVMLSMGLSHKCSLLRANLSALMENVMNYKDLSEQLERKENAISSVPILQKKLKVL